MFYLTFTIQNRGSRLARNAWLIFSFVWARNGDGGAAGLTESPAANRRLMVAGHEIARAVRKFENTYDVRKPDDTRHYEEVPSVREPLLKMLKPWIPDQSNWRNEEAHSVKTVPIFLYWTLRKSCLIAMWKLFRLLRQNNRQCTTNM